MKRLAALLLAAVLAGCAGDADSVGDASVRVYLLRDGGGTVRPVRRDVDEATSRAALNELLEVASSQEAGELGATSGIPEGSSVDVFSLEGDTATVALTTELGDDGLAQVVFTLTQFPSVRSVDIQGGTFPARPSKALTRRPFSSSPRCRSKRSRARYGQPARPTRSRRTSSTS